jgi:hypothetical protein
MFEPESAGWNEFFGEAIEHERIIGVRRMSERQSLVFHRRHVAQGAWKTKTKKCPEFVPAITADRR